MTIANLLVPVRTAAFRAEVFLLGSPPYPDVANQRFVLRHQVPASSTGCHRRFAELKLSLFHFLLPKEQSSTMLVG